MLMNLRCSMSRRAGYTYVFAVSLMTSSSRFIARRATTGAKLERESICRVDLLVFLPAPRRFVRMKNIFSRLLARNIRYQCIYGMSALPYQKKKKKKMKYQEAKRFVFRSRLSHVLVINILDACRIIDK